MASDRDCQSDTRYLSISDIIDQMKKVKADDEDMKKKFLKPHYQPPGGWKEGSFKSLRITKNVTFIPRQNDRISRFHVLEPKWDRHQFLDHELEQVIQFVLCSYLYDKNNDMTDDIHLWMDTNFFPSSLYYHSLQAIHRLPCGDSSGTVIADFSREKNGRNLLAGRWCPGTSKCIYSIEYD